MIRNQRVVLATAALVGVIVASGLSSGSVASSPQEAASATAYPLKTSARLQTFADKNNDVRLRVFGGGVETGAWDADIRKVRAGITRHQVRAKITFDPASSVRERLSVHLFLRASGDDPGYWAAIDQTLIEGERPRKWLARFYPGEFNPITVPCSGFRAKLGRPTVTFIIPKRCLQSSQFQTKRISIKTEYYYGDAEGYDRFPQRGTRRISLGRP
ncbi:hypothetical protein [Nocardioides sp. SYSU D00038]|uniref:hypothetical protein n=1 Tax=Nocardioides sp. SYSU D00038 TaxID=2812554 RepID=UPI001967837E|nr:hypothetical protein [Nocardioides sp. SYSU D00038]